MKEWNVLRLLEQIDEEITLRETVASLSSVEQNDRSRKPKKACHVCFRNQRTDQLHSDRIVGNRTSDISYRKRKDEFFLGGKRSQDDSCTLKIWEKKALEVFERRRRGIEYSRMLDRSLITD